MGQTHEVTCVNRAPTWDGSHAHITHLGLGTAAGYYQRVTVDDVIAQLRSSWGDRYFTISPSTGRRADIVEGGCKVCGQHPYVRTTADGVYDNNLDSLSMCQLP